MKNDYLGQFNNVEKICINNTIHRLYYKKTFWLKKWITFCGKKTKQPDWIAGTKGMILDDYNLCKQCKIIND